jgi:transposase
MLREFGIVAPKGADGFLARLPQLLEAHRGQLPEAILRLVHRYWAEATELAERMVEIERDLEGLARSHPVMQRLMEIPGIGALTATALYASIGNIHLFPSGRQLASWLGITPTESSSGSKRRLGRISKRGDAYLRTLLIHGARSALRAAQVRQSQGKPLTRLQTWAVEKAASLYHSNQAAVGLANKMARIVWAVWKYERRFDANHVSLPRSG